MKTTTSAAKWTLEVRMANGNIGRLSFDTRREAEKRALRGDAVALVHRAFGYDVRVKIEN
jgi:hypothetical protein